VVELVVIVTALAGGVVVVVVLAELDVRGRRPPALRSTPSNVKPPEESWVTFPEAKEKLAN